MKSSALEDLIIVFLKIEVTMSLKSMCFVYMIVKHYMRVSSVDHSVPAVKSFFGRLSQPVNLI